MPGLTAPPDDIDPVGEVIEADGWFPAIATDHVRKSVRLGEGIVTDERLKAAIFSGMLTALRELADWRSARAAEGVADLSSVVAPHLGEISIAALLWQRIVTFYAAAEIVDGHTDVSATDEALDREEDKVDQADRYRRKAYDAVADLRALGLPVDAPRPHGRNRVSLI
ncbi:MAG: head completion/stabilization protein [Erythrobacter sp.]|nr:head completion/stabilization protein [Erythrobacter sp.]